MSPITLPANASEEEIAAVLAVLLGSRVDAVPDRYRLWRKTRLKALRDKASPSGRAT